MSAVRENFGVGGPAGEGGEPMGFYEDMVEGGETIRVDFLSGGLVEVPISGSFVGVGLFKRVPKNRSLSLTEFHGV